MNGLFKFILVYVMLCKYLQHEEDSSFHALKKKKKILFWSSAASNFFVEFNNCVKKYIVMANVSLWFSKTTEYWYPQTHINI